MISVRSTRLRCWGRGNCQSISPAAPPANRTAAAKRRGTVAACQALQPHSENSVKTRAGFQFLSRIQFGPLPFAAGLAVAKQDQAALADGHAVLSVVSRELDGADVACFKLIDAGPNHFSIAHHGH